jgi:uncharacterized protein (DUF1501 family)
MPGAATDLWDCAAELLAAAAIALETEAPAGPIDYQAIWPGLPSYDCVPALYVHVGGPAIADTYPLQPPLQPMQRIVTSGEVNIVQLTITVLRCVPVIEQESQSILLPSPALINQSAHDVLGDLWAIWNYLKNQHRLGNLYQTPSGRREFAFDPAQPVRTSGGAGGWEIPIRVQLGGY